MNINDGVVYEYKIRVVENLSFLINFVCKIFCYNIK